MTTEEKLMHAIVSDAIAACRVPVPQESPRARSEFNGALADALEVGLPVARDQLDAVARAQRAEDALIDAQLDRDHFRDQRDELRVRVDELEAEIRELRGEA